MQILKICGECDDALRVVSVQDDNAAVTDSTERRKEQRVLVFGEICVT